MKPSLIVLAVIGLAGCAGGPPRPVSIDTANDACAHCRMIASDPRVAAQIVAPGEEPLVFDDIGCLREFLAGHDTPHDAAVFVADHRSGAWVPAASAVYTRSAAHRTPMASGIFAHADSASRDADPGVAHGEAVAVEAILAKRHAAGGGR